MATEEQTRKFVFPWLPLASWFPLGKLENNKLPNCFKEIRREDGCSPRRNHFFFFFILLLSLSCFLTRCGTSSTRVNFLVARRSRILINLLKKFLPHCEARARCPSRFPVFYPYHQLPSAAARCQYLFHGHLDRRINSYQQDKILEKIKNL